jgi:AraC family transcriptional regulator of arabinose operon
MTMAAKPVRRAQQRSSDIQFNMSGLVVYPPGTRLESRQLKDYEMVWILAGNVVWEHDGVEENVDPNSVILSRPGTIESYTWDPRHRTQHGFFHFDIRKHPRGLPPPAAWPFLRRVTTGDALRPLLHHIAWLIGARPTHWQTAAESALKHALLMFVHDLTRTAAEPAPTAHPVIERAMDYLRRTWTDGCRSCSLAELAGAAGSSPTHLSRLFRAELGVSPGWALRVLRLQRSAMLLTRTSSSVQAISALVGFATPFHFSDTFHRHYRMSPTAYRKRAMEGQTLPTLLLGRLRTFHPDLSYVG